MTSYFDDAQRAARDVKHKDGFDAEYLAGIAAVEEPVVRDVMLNVKDSEFPSDLRQEIGRIVSAHGIFAGFLPPMEEATEYVLTMHYSRLIEELHSVFHTLARRRAKTRFGEWGDNPRSNLLSCKEHDEDPEPKAAN